MTSADRTFVYSISLLLPRELDDRLGEWARTAEGATVDPVASHVTLATFHSPAVADEVARRLRPVCRRFEPFLLRLDVVLQEPYWGKEDLDIVMLATSPEDPAFEHVTRLRRELLAALGSLLIESSLPSEEFVPHLTLTTGLSHAEAHRLADAARGLEVAFTVREVWLWQQSGEGPWPLVAGLPLGSD